VKTVVFLENQSQVLWIEREFSLHEKTQLVAITAEALQSLEEYKIPHFKISDYADSRHLAAVQEKYNADIFELAKNIELFLADRCSSLQFEGVGFLSGQAYYLQYSVAAIATRAFLMRETILALSPQKVILFAGAIDPWFQDNGYLHNPWIDVIVQLSDLLNFKVELLPDPNAPKAKSKSLCDVIDVVNQKLNDRELINENSDFTRVKLSNQQDSLRLLFLGNSIYYDWNLVLENLRNKNNIECFLIQDNSLNQKDWGRYYSSSILSYWKKIKFNLGVNAPKFDKAEVLQIAKLFEKWRSQSSQTTTLDVLGMNVLPALMQHLKVLACISPTLLRHTDSIALQALTKIQPHAVCLFAMPWLSVKRFAYQCSLQNIPIISYQHGGVYGTHLCPSHLLAEFSYADYFLSYGSGIQPPIQLFKKVRARFIPIGSTRIEKNVFNHPTSELIREPLQILWIGEASTQNTIGGAYQVEDTRRYIQQRKCLEILASNQNLKIIYRPFPQDSQLQATSSWLQRSNFSAIEINFSQPLEKLTKTSDLVIIDSASSTTWNEVLALQKPLILYCDPQQTYLMPHFASDLEKVCCWCKTEDELEIAIQKLANEGNKLIRELQKLDTSEFIQKYILSREDGQCVQRVISFLEIVCRDRKSLKIWEREWQEKLNVTDKALIFSKQADGCVLRGELQEAIALYKQAIAIQPDLAICHRKLIQVYQKEEQFYEQREDKEKALLSRYQAYSLQPGIATATAHYDLGLALQQQGKINEAIECYRSAISVESTLARAYISLGNLLIKQRKLLEAMNYYRRAIALKSKNI
jgi:tetratricopeptide (TPR) repeat protein